MLGILKIVQIVVSIVLVALVLIQSKSAGLSSSLKSSFNMYRSLRGVERIVFVLTIVFGILLVLNSLALVLVS